MKHIISILLALCLALSILPETAAATTGGMGNFKKTRDYHGFSDVPASQWFANDVRQAYELGLVNGKGDGKFDPNGNLTIAEAITMAVQIHATYYGNTFVPGGNPWYANAVLYAVNNNMIQADSYGNYASYATRLDLVGLFTSIPMEEFPRINRVSWIPDVSQYIDYENTSYADYIYRFYAAGVLTGGEGGAFKPEALVKRSEAAAIINRVVLPENRVHVSSTASTPGQTYSDPNGYFEVSIPKQGWTNEISNDGTLFVHAMENSDNSIAVEVLGISTIQKSDLDGIEFSLHDVSVFMKLGSLMAGDGDNVIFENDAPHERLVRDLDCYLYKGIYSDQSFEGSLEIVCFENLSSYYIVAIIVLPRNQSPTHELYDILYSMNIPL